MVKHNKEKKKKKKDKDKKKKDKSNKSTHQTVVVPEDDKLALLEKIVLNLRLFDRNVYSDSLAKLVIGVSDENPETKCQFLKKIRILKKGNKAGICVILVEIDDPSLNGPSKDGGLCSMEFVLREGDMYLDSLHVNGGKLIHFFKKDAEVTLNLPETYPDMAHKGANLKTCKGSHMSVLNACHVFYKWITKESNPTTTAGLKHYPLKEFVCAYMELCVGLCETTRLRRLFNHVLAHYPDGLNLELGLHLVDDIHKWDDYSEELDDMVKTKPSKAARKEILAKLRVAKVIDKKSKKKK